MLITKGDILQGLVPGHHTTVILHGCNCMNVMGAGIALYLKQKFPVVYEVDLSTQRGSDRKLGSFSFAEVSPNLIVANCYTQFCPGKDARIDSIESALRAVHRQFGDEVEYRSPKIGCGIGGLTWEAVRPVFVAENFQNLQIFYK